MLAMFMSARQWWIDDAVANFWKPAAETQLHDECANCNMIVKAEKYKETHYRQGCISSLKCEKQSFVIFSLRTEQDQVRKTA